MEQGPALVPVSFALTTDTNYKVEGSGTISTEYRRNKLTVSAEYWWQNSVQDNSISGAPVPLPMLTLEQEMLGYYGQVAYRFNPRFELSAYYSVYYPDKNDKDGDRFVMRGQSAAQAWSKDLTVSARFDITRNMLFKLEGHFIDGSAMVNALHNPQGVEDDYTLVLGRFTFYF